MGLDIHTKNDYARFNWTGATNFIGWSNKHLDISPFPSWDGGNGSVVVFNEEPKDEREIKGNIEEAKQWCEALEKYCKKIDDAILTVGQGERIGEIAWRMVELGARKTYKEKKIKGFKEDYSFRYKENRIEWEYIQAIKWYFVMKDAIENGSIAYW